MTILYVADSGHHFSGRDMETDERVHVHIHRIDIEMDAKIPPHAHTNPSPQKYNGPPLMPILRLPQ